MYSVRKYGNAMNQEDKILKLADENNGKIQTQPAHALRSSSRHIVFLIDFFFNEQLYQIRIKLSAGILN